MSDVQGNKKLRDKALARTRDVCFLECMLENLYRGVNCFISFLKGDGQRQRGRFQTFSHSAHASQVSYILVKESWSSYSQLHRISLTRP